MMENHSFDNVLGMMGRGDCFPKGKDGRRVPEGLVPDPVTGAISGGPVARGTSGLTIGTRVGKSPVGSQPFEFKVVS